MVWVLLGFGGFGYFCIIWYFGALYSVDFDDFGCLLLILKGWAYAADLSGFRVLPMGFCVFWCFLFSV